jgi:hypothetical protein
LRLKEDFEAPWVGDVKVDKHQVFFATSPSECFNNDLGLAWLGQVFKRRTQEKAWRSWRLLLLVGHGSDVTNDFIDHCDTYRILLMVLPPHSTHTLQSLDVVMFKPLSTAHSAELTEYLFRSQGLIPIQKSDFFPLFWKVWMSSFTQGLIQKSFGAAGIIPPDADVILQRFNYYPSGKDEGQSSE